MRSDPSPIAQPTLSRGQKKKIRFPWKVGLCTHSFRPSIVSGLVGFIKMYSRITQQRYPTYIVILSIPTGEWNFADHCIYPMAAQGASRFFSIVPFINNPAETTYTDYMPAFEFEFQGLFFSLACFSGFRDCPLFARFFIFFETNTLDKKVPGRRWFRRKPRSVFPGRESSPDCSKASGDELYRKTPVHAVSRWGSRLREESWKM